MMSFNVPVFKYRKVKGRRIPVVVGFIPVIAESAAMASELVEKMYSEDTTLEIGAAVVGDQTV